MSAAVAVALALAVLGAASASAQEPEDAPTTTEERSIPDDAFTIVGTPEAGPKPEHPGDRGGWAQFLTLGLIVTGVGVVAWRIAHGMRTSARQRAAGDPG